MSETQRSDLEQSSYRSAGGCARRSMLLSLIPTFFPRMSLELWIVSYPLPLSFLQLRLVWQEVEAPDVFSSFRENATGHQKYYYYTLYSSAVTSG